MTASIDTDILKLENVVTIFDAPAGEIRAVNGVTLAVERGRMVAIVGESGSGKSVLAKTIMGLLPGSARVDAESRVTFEGRNLLTLSSRDLRAIRGEEIGMVFQDAMTALNPVVRIGRQISEILRAHTPLRGRALENRSVELLRAVGIAEPRARLRSYPHGLSGGMRQRVAIAIAIACEPKLLIADEPTTALDVTVQHQILELIDQLRRDHNMAVILVTHDLAIVAGRADEVVVMYGGKVMESGRTDAVFKSPRHPYTELLLKCIPRMTDEAHSKLATIEGRPVPVIGRSTHCVFVDRCPYAQARCRDEDPELLPIDDVSDAHQVRCFFPVGTAAGDAARAANSGADPTSTGAQS